MNDSDQARVEQEELDRENAEQDVQGAVLTKRTADLMHEAQYLCQ